MTDGDQALAAEPGFYGEAPGGGNGVVMTVSHGSDSPPEVREQQSENGGALAAIPAQALSGAVEDRAGAAALEAAPGAMVEFMDCGGTTPLWMHGGQDRNVTTFRGVQPKRGRVPAVHKDLRDRRA